MIAPMSADPGEAPPAPSASRRGRIVLALLVAASSLACDLSTKAWAWENLRPTRKPVVVIDPLFELSFSFNTGAAFGFLVGVSWARVFFIVVTLLALCYMAFLAWSMPTRQRYGYVAVALISAGAAGNLHDRLVRADEAGRFGVVDFLKINYPWGGSWPTFNVADVLLLVGVGLLFVFIRREAPLEPQPTS
jgi:signal peptidase II